ncbi:DUF11 domain-containing protein [Candidatus Saccharibacteria bacterium]|nr:DUF11 domain-containing protein [Candidatus Saccharibacteria bacterium]
MIQKLNLFGKLGTRKSIITLAGLGLVIVGAVNITSVSGLNQQTSNNQTLSKDVNPIVNGNPDYTTTTVNAGGELEWIIEYGNDTGSIVDPVTITDDIIGGQQYVGGSLDVPLGWEEGYSTNGGSSYSPTEPAASSVNSLQATGNRITSPSTGINGLIPAPVASVNQDKSVTHGDGYLPIVYRSGDIYRVYNIYHHNSWEDGDATGIINCFDVNSGDYCADTSFDYTTGLYTPLTGVGVQTSWFPEGQQAVINGKFYYAVHQEASSNVGVGCLDLATGVDCTTNSYTQISADAPWYTYANANKNHHAGIEGPAVVGDTLYFFVRHSNGKLYMHSYNTTTGVANTTGVQINTTGVYLNDPIQSEGELYVPYEVIGTKIYFTINFQISGTKSAPEFGCFDTATNSACAGYSSTAILPNATATANFAAGAQTWIYYSVYPVYLPNGSVDSVCTSTLAQYNQDINNPAGYQYPTYCYSPTSNTPYINTSVQSSLEAFWASYSSIPAVSSMVNNSSQGVNGMLMIEEININLNGANRTYFATRSSDQYPSNNDETQGLGIVACYDFTNSQPCAGFGTAGLPAGIATFGNVNPSQLSATPTFGNTQDYGYDYDQVSGCMWGLGDEGYLWSFDAETGASPCSSISETIELDLNPDNFYCDGKSDNYIQGWDSLTVLEPGSGVPATVSYTVTVYDVNNNPISGYQNITLPASNQLDLSGINSTTYSSLRVEVTAADSNNGTSWTNTIPVMLTFEATNNPQVCYRTIVPDNCDITSADNTAVVDADGTTISVSDSIEIINQSNCDPGRIGNQVWNDLDRDGVFDTGEPGIPGVVVKLYQGVCSSNTAQSTPIATTTTGSDGTYYFNGLPVDQSYYVIVDKTSNSVINDYTLSVGSNQSADNYSKDDSCYEVNLTTANPTNLTADFGYYAGRIGNQIWIDLDRDGIFDDGLETGVAGVTVKLYQGVCSSHTTASSPLSTTTTANDGTYYFDELALDQTYYVIVDRTGSSIENYLHVMGSDQSADNYSKDETCYGVNLTAGNPENLTADFGYYASGIDIAVNKEIVGQADGATLARGQKFTYRITVTNLGPDEAKNITIKDQFPGGITVEPGSVSCVFKNPENTCDINPAISNYTGILTEDQNIGLLVNQKLVIDVVATVDKDTSGTIINIVEVAEKGREEVTYANNKDTVSFVVPKEIDLAITKTHDPAQPTAGGIVTYTIVVVNNGPDDVEGATMNDNVPEVITAVSWTCTASANAVCLDTSGSGNQINAVSNMLNGASVTYSVVGTLSGSASGEIVNQASVTAPEGYIETTLENNTDSTAFSIAPPASLPQTGFTKNLSLVGILSLMLGLFIVYKQLRNLPANQ